MVPEEDQEKYAGVNMSVCKHLSRRTLVSLHVLPNLKGEKVGGYSKIKISFSSCQIGDLGPKFLNAELQAIGLG